MKNKPKTDNVQEDAADVLQVPMKKIERLQDVDKLQEILEIHCEEFRRIKCKRLEIEEEIEKTIWQSASHECQQVERDLKNDANVSANFDENFAEEKQKGDMKMRFYEHQCESTFKNTRKKIFKEGRVDETRRVTSLLDINDTQMYFQKHLKRLQSNWTKKIERIKNEETKKLKKHKKIEGTKGIKKIKDSKKFKGTIRGGSDLKSKQEIETNEDDYDDNLDVLEENIKWQKLMWQEFAKDIQEDAYVGMIGKMESVRNDTLNKQLEFINKQFEQILKVKREIIIQTNTVEEIDKLIDKEVITPPKLPKKDLFKKLTMKKEKLLSTLHKRIQKVQCLREQLRLLERELSLKQN